MPTISPMVVRYVDHMGSDLSTVNAARVSFNKRSTELSEKDIKLIQYLARHNHWTPFGHNSVTLQIKAPFFVARQLAKHQIGGVWNEVSRRYVDDEPEFYIPGEFRGRADNKKQGSGGALHPQRSKSVALEMESAVITALSQYQWLLQCGIAPEQARGVLPECTHTEWYWTGSIAFFSRVFNLRADAHAQVETQIVARQIGEIISPLFPHSWASLTKRFDELEATH